jgi:hypothetical protein
LTSQTRETGRGILFRDANLFPDFVGVRSGISSSGVEVASFRVKNIFNVVEELIECLQSRHLCLRSST